MAQLLDSIQWDYLIRNKPLAAILGLFSHFILNRGEWDSIGHLLLSTWVIGFSLAAYVEFSVDPRVHTPADAVHVVAEGGAFYFGTMIISILVYRGFFHRLQEFPGPFLLRLSKLFSLAYVIPNYQYYNEVEKLHWKYNSDIIRTGPRELSVATVDAVPLIHGPMSKCTKGPWYSTLEHLEGVAVNATRDKSQHRERRKAWDLAFSAKSLREYEPRINRHTLALMTKLEEHAREPSVRISDWIDFYSFDVMADIGFNRSFGMIEKGKEDPLVKKLHESMSLGSIFAHIAWTIGLITRLTLGGRDLLEMMAWASKVLRERKQTNPKEKDVFSFLMDPNDEDIPVNLNADSRLMMVAGSDTTGATLVWLCYELCKDPTIQSKLRTEVDQIALGKAFLSAEDLTNCPYLDGVIHEALRLHPAVPSGVQRETPPEGLTLPNGTYIPGETLIWMPIHTIQRDARYFPSPLSFLPERWFPTNSNTNSNSPQTQPLITDKRAFLTFSTGIYNCVGQKLAIMEMRAVIANLVRGFEMRFAEGEDGGRVERESRDCFTLNVGRLDVRLLPRWE